MGGEPDDLPYSLESEESMTRSTRERMGCFSVPKVVFLPWTEGINMVAMIGRIIPRKVENLPSSQVQYRFCHEDGQHSFGHLPLCLSS